MARYTQAANPMELSAVVAASQAAGLSQKYQFIPTTRVIDLLEGEGWRPVLGTQVKVRNQERDGFQKHMIRFRREGDSMQVKGLAPGMLIPELVMTNGHAGLDSFTFGAGIYRVVCGNGLIVADATFASIRVRHMGFEAAQVFAAVQSIVQAVPELGERVERFRSITLSEVERNLFAEHAAHIKYPELERAELARKVELPRLLQPIRSADQGRDLWSTFNVLQEKLIRGGRFGQREKETYSGRKYLVPAKARGTTAITETVRINKALWNLAEDFANLKTSNN